MHLSKAVRRTLRTVRTEWRLFQAKPFRRRPWTVPFLIFASVLGITAVAFAIFGTLFRPLIYRESPREQSHFTHHVHSFVPRAVALDAVRQHRCSWLYLEFGAKDGRYLDRFLTNGNGFLEDFLRSSQSVMRAFCAVAFEPDPAMATFLADVRSRHAKKTAHLNVFTQVVPGTHNGSEIISMTSVDDNARKHNVNAASVALGDFVRGITFDWEDSGREVANMHLARANANFGAVIVRLNVADMREAYWHLDNLEVPFGNGLMCKRIDRLVLNMHSPRLEPSKRPLDIEDRKVVREWDKIVTPPSSSEYNAKNGIDGLVRIAREVNQRSGCRTKMHVIDETGRMLAPTILSQREVFYAILAGQPTFDERVNAQAETWMTAVPQDRLTIFTNQTRSPDEMKAAHGRDTAAVYPNKPELEQKIHMMQSWSHLVRVRESWDRTMKHNPEIKWLALVDDDTFVFPGGVRAYLSGFDHRVRLWGGSGEQARVDNGDSGIFANWLRGLHEKHGGKHCYLPHEDVPRQHRKVRVEYAISEVLNGRKAMKMVSHMCHDTFCKRGCPAVPQGAAIFLSRPLVEALRPHIEKCEQDTSRLCKNCGSQRLYMCVNRYAGEARTLLTRGVCRAPWKLERREGFPFAITYHGFQKYHGRFLSTGSIHGDMLELWQLGKTYEDGVSKGSKPSYLIPMQKIADLIGCHGQGRYQKGFCITEDGIKLPSTDGNPKHDKKLAGHGASERKGSA